VASIRDAGTRADLDAFLRVPWRLYRGDRNWVPPLLGEQRWLFSDRNPFWAHGRRRLFIAESGGEAIGRVAAIVDDDHNHYHEERTGFFGFFECANDPRVAGELLTASAEWLTEQGMTLVRGPVNPSLNDEAGLLVEGFDRPPAFMMTYNPPWYGALIEGWGLRKVKDLLAYSGPCNAEIVARLERAAERVRRRYPDLLIRPINLRAIERDLLILRDLYNSAWGDNWGFVPITDAEVKATAGRLRPLIRPGFVVFAERAGVPVGFGMGMPDYNEIFLHLNGRLGPAGMLRFLWMRRRIRLARVLTLGVVSEYRRQGVEAFLIASLMRAGYETGIQAGEYSWILEDNTAIQRVIEFVGGRLYKRYRLYERPLPLPTV
jgi:hypothetical protein